MNHVFASSHLPEDNRPLEDEEEEVIQPMQRAGGVRAFSHLPQPAQGEPAAPRPTALTYLPSWITEPLHAEPWTAAEAAPESHGDFEPPATAGRGSATGLHALSNPLTLLNSRPSDQRGMPPEPAAQQPQQLSGDPGRFSDYSRSNSPGSPCTDTPPETSARGANPPARGGGLGAQPQAPAQAQRSATVLAQNAPAAPQPQKQGQPPDPQRAAEAGLSTAKEPAPQQQIKIDASDPRFEAAARAAMAEEAADSPVAAALQKEAARLGFSIAPPVQKNRFIPPEELMSETLMGTDGKPVIHFNPLKKTDTTMSHEITHVIQMTAFQQYIDEVKKTGKTPDKDDLKNAIKAGRDAVNKIVPVKSDKDEGQDYKENDAMRAAHIVRAERTASEMKNLPEEQKTLEEFQRRQAEKEKAKGEKEKGIKHQNNAKPIPEGTERGSYDYQYVRDILGLDEKGKKKPKPLPVQPPKPPIQLPTPQPFL